MERSPPEKNLESELTRIQQSADAWARGPETFYVPDGLPYRSVKAMEYITRSTLGAIALGAFALAAGYGTEAYQLAHDTTIAHPELLAPDVAWFTLASLYSSIVGAGTTALLLLSKKLDVRRVSELRRHDASPK